MISSRFIVIDHDVITDHAACQAVDRALAPPAHDRITADASVGQEAASRPAGRSGVAGAVGEACQTAQGVVGPAQVAAGGRVELVGSDGLPLAS